MQMSVIKRELAEDGRASISARYVKTWCGGNSSVEAWFAKIVIKHKIILALTDRGSSVNLLSDTLYHQLGEPNQIRVCSKNKITANNGKMLAKRSTAIQVNSFKNLHLR